MVISVGIIIGAAGLTFGLISFLQSPAGSQYVLTKARAMLEQKALVKVEYQKANLDLFSGIRLEELRLTPLTLAEPLEIRVKSVDLRYHLSFFPLRLVVEPLLLVDLNLNGGLHSPDSKVPDSKMPDTKMKVQLNHLTARLRGEWTSEHLVANGTLNSGAVDYSSSQPSGTQKLHLDSQTARFNLVFSPLTHKETDEVSVQLTYEGHKLTANGLPLNKSGDLNLKATAQFPRSFAQLKTQGAVSYNSIPFCNFDLRSQFGKELHLSSRLKIEVNPRLAPSLGFLSSLKAKGLLNKPWNLVVDSESEWESQKQRLTLNGTFLIENEFGKWIAKTDLRSEFQASPPGIQSQGQTHEQTQGSISLEQEGESTFKGFKFLLPFKADFNAQKEGNSHFTLKELTASFSDSMLKLVAEATGDSKAQNFQTQGTMILQIPHPISLLPAQTIEGRIEIPWTLAVYHGSAIHFEGLMNILNVNWSKSPTKESPSSVKVIGLSGKIPVSEQLTWTGKTLKFTELISQNPFERVDFDRLQPMIYDSDQISLQEIRFEEKSYGPLQGFFSMRQNRVFAHKFDFKLGTGNSFGEMYFDLYPSNLQLGVLARMTGLNLHEVLPEKYLAHARKKGDSKTGDSKSGDSKNEIVSGRSGLVIQLNSGTVNGRVDVTEIGRKQLMTLINIVDPQYENQQMNRARFALGIASPSSIQMSFQQGYMDMGFRLDGAIKQDFALRGIPISSWVSSAKAEFIKKPQEEFRKD